MSGRSRRRARREAERAAAAAAKKEPRAAPTVLDRAGEFGRALLSRRWFAPVVLLVLTVAVWARSVAAPLHYWDDKVYIFEDRRVESLTPSNVSAIFTRSFFANYHPVTTLTYATDRALWGNWLPGYHLTQLAFYSGGVVILYFLFAQAGRGLRRLVGYRD